MNFPKKKGLALKLLHEICLKLTLLSNQNPSDIKSNKYTIKQAQCKNL